MKESPIQNPPKNNDTTYPVILPPIEGQSSIPEPQPMQRPTNIDSKHKDIMLPELAQNTPSVTPQFQVNVNQSNADLIEVINLTQDEDPDKPVMPFGQHISITPQASADVSKKKRKVHFEPIAQQTRSTSGRSSQKRRLSLNDSPNQPAIVNQIPPPQMNVVDLKKYWIRSPRTAFRMLGKLIFFISDMKSQQIVSTSTIYMWYGIFLRAQE